MDQHQPQGAALRTPSLGAPAAAAPAVRQRAPAKGQQQPLEQPPPEEPPTQRQAPLTWRIEQSAAIYAVIAQAVMWKGYAPGLAPAGHARQAAISVLNAVFLVQALCLPHALWLRLRWVLVRAGRAGGR